MIEVLQSQLFVLKVLSIAMACRWQRRSEDGRPDSSLGKRSNGPPSVSSAPDSPAGSGHRIPRGRQASSEQLGSLSPWIEPSPLDENCARYILSVMVLFLRQAAPQQQLQQQILYQSNGQHQQPRAVSNGAAMMQPQMAVRAMQQHQQMSAPGAAMGMGGVARGAGQPIRR